MGLIVNRKVGESVTMDFPDGTIYKIMRGTSEKPKHSRLTCRAFISGRKPETKWSLEASFGDTIHVAENIQLRYERCRTANAVSLIIDAPHEVIIYRTECPRTADDRLYEVMRLC